MPYIGVRVLHKNKTITIKFHGPLDVIPVWPNELRNEARDLLNNYNDELTIRDKIDQLAEDLKEKYCDGEELLWVSVELTNNELIYGATAEKVLVD